MDVSEFRIKKGTKVNLDKIDPAETGTLEKEDAKTRTEKLKERLADLQDRLFAEKKHAVLMILQGMDSSGKDGVVKHALSGVNPAGYRIHSFKQPAGEELAHDFLWRAHHAAPGKGYIGIFNRSHYEDILVPRVHGAVSDKVIRQRLKHIHDFERLLSENGTQIVKIFLHISKEMQMRKFEERIEDPTKMWKFDETDLRERQHWDAYEKTYELIFEECNPKYAPWYVVPADHRWFRNYVSLQILVSVLESLSPEYPVLEREKAQHAAAVIQSEMQTEDGQTL